MSVCRMENVDHLLKQALGAHQAGDLTQAEQLYQQVLAQHPDNAQVHNNLATLYVKKGEYQKALHAYRNAVHNAPDYLDAHFNLGSLLLRLSEW